MTIKYKNTPSRVKKSEIFLKKSLSGKDYSKIKELPESKLLRDMVEYKVGNSFLREDFLSKDVSNKYRFIKTGNLSPYRILLDFHSVQYCKPNGDDELEDEDILIAKDGGSSGLGEVSIYYKDKGIDVDYFCGEILRIRVMKEYNKWFLISILKSQYFKEYMDIVTPGGSTLRHSKLLALDFKVPYPIKKKKEYIDYIGLLTQNLVYKEKQMKIKINKINKLINDELQMSSNKLPKYKYPRINQLKELNRLDTGVYTSQYFYLDNVVKRYKNGYFYISNKNIKPGRTPDDYKYTDKKLNNTYLWITPKNINSLELIFNTYINTKAQSKIKNYDIILSGIRYLGYGFFVDKDEVIYCNQNTLIISNSSEMKEQIYLLAFLTSEIGQRMQLCWRVDGMVPIIYKDDLARIPIPKIEEEIKEEIVNLYYNEIKSDNKDLSTENYIDLINRRNSQIGIYQLNREILLLRNKIEDIIRSLIYDKAIEKTLIM